MEINRRIIKKLEKCSSQELANRKRWLEEDGNGRESSGANFEYAVIQSLLDQKKRVK
jgi:hypothetical protein